jgi:uncharacterized protein (DUF1015 family)
MSRPDRRLLMARIYPFRAYRYDTARFDLARVLTQPYDKITPAMQERYYALDEHNLVRVEKGRAQADDGPQSNVYTRAAQTLEQWIREGVLRPDAATSLYVCSQEFKVPGSDQRRVRRGLMTLLGLEDYAAGVVFRHERTHTAARTDRLEVLRHTRTHTGQLMMLFDDAGNSVTSRIEGVMRAAPENQLEDEFGVVHRLWAVSDPAAIEHFVRALADRKLLIADGHHRYETALVYRDECRAGGAGSSPDAPHEKTLATLFALQDSGVVVLPTHRTVRAGGDSASALDFGGLRKSVEGIFDWYAYPFAEEEQRGAALSEFRHDMAAALRGGSARRPIGVYAGTGAFYLFVLQAKANLDDVLGDVPLVQRSLDVVLLHRVLLERCLGLTPEAVEREKNIGYHRDAAEAIAAVDSGAAACAFLLSAIPARQVYELALEGNVLPQKSTDFYPKLLSGLAIYRLDG